MASPLRALIVRIRCRRQFEGSPGQQIWFAQRGHRLDGDRRAFLRPRAAPPDRPLSRPDSRARKRTFRLCKDGLHRHIAYGGLVLLWNRHPEDGRVPSARRLQQPPLTRCQDISRSPSEPSRVDPPCPRTAYVPHHHPQDSTWKEWLPNGGSLLDEIPGSVSKAILQPTYLKAPPGRVKCTVHRGLIATPSNSLTRSTGSGPSFCSRPTSSGFPRTCAATLPGLPFSISANQK